MGHEVFSKQLDDEFLLKRTEEKFEILIFSRLVWNFSFLEDE